MSTDTTDALTRLARYARDLAEDDCEAILSLISEAREEQRKVTVRAKNEGLEAAKRTALEWASDDDGDPDHEVDAICLNALAACLDDMKDPGP